MNDMNMTEEMIVIASEEKENTDVNSMEETQADLFDVLMGRCPPSIMCY